MAKLSYVILALFLLFCGCELVDPERFGRIEIMDVSKDERQEKIALLEWGENHFDEFVEGCLDEEEEIKKFRQFLLLMANIMGYEHFDVEKIIVLSLEEGQKNRGSNGCFNTETGHLKLNPIYQVKIKTLIHEYGHAFYEGLLYRKLSIGPGKLEDIYFGITSKQVFDRDGWKKHYELIAERNVFRYLQARARFTSKRALKNLELYPAVGGYMLCRNVGKYVSTNGTFHDEPALPFLLTASDHQTLWETIKVYNPGEHGQAVASITMANFEEVILTSHYDDQDYLTEKISSWAPSQIRKAVNLALKERTIKEHFERFFEKRKKFFSQFADE